MADIDGSGTTDVIYLHPEGPTLYLNRSGNGWSSPERLSGLPVGDLVRSVQVSDLLGRGAAQIVWSSPLTAEAYSPLRYIDLMAAGKPHLLTEVKNNVGRPRACATPHPPVSTWGTRRPEGLG